jgi:hypothetical protein
MSKQEEIIEVCGKKVVVRYARTQEEACASCAFCSRKECHDLDCNMRDIIGESVSKYAYFAEPWIRCSDCALLLGGKCTRPGGECARKAPLSEEIHSLREWAQILATNPDLRAEFDKMCPPQPIQGSIAPEADLEAEIERYESVIYGFEGSSRADCLHIARHFAEWGAEHLRK